MRFQKVAGHVLGNFWGSLLVLIVAIVLSHAYQGLYGVYFMVLLAALEIFFSVDNAFGNASILKEWDDRWQRMFLFWGILVAVVFVRLVLPVAIVSMSAWKHPWDTMLLAWYSPHEYYEALHGAKYKIDPFAGVFLITASAHYFIDPGKDVHWIPGIEALLVRLGRFPLISKLLLILPLFSLVTAEWIEEQRQFAFFTSGMIGLVSSLAMKFLADLSKRAGSLVSTGSLAGFIYLECFDASFSLDGVVTAFAVVSDPVLIMLGLGVGAAFVRSGTIYLVRTKVMATYRYLEHGAFLSIGIVGGLVIVGVKFPTPEYVIALVGFVVLGFAYRSSKIANDRESAVA